MIKVKTKNPLVAVYRLPFDCSNSDYLWGFYTAHSILGTFTYYHQRDNETGKIVEMMEYRFPAWWAKKIEHNLPEK